MSSIVSLIVQDSSDSTVPIYSNTSYFMYRSVTNVATSDLLPVLPLGDAVTVGGSGGKSNSLLVSCLIYFTRPSCSPQYLVSFSLIFLSFSDTRCLFRENLHLHSYTIPEMFQYILLHHIPGTDLSQMLQHLVCYQCSRLEIMLILDGFFHSFILLSDRRL